MTTAIHPHGQMLGLISATQRFSIHDGPGIRTLVFMKGCPLRCLWCDNPETQQSQPQLLYRAHLCIGCGSCLEACPNSAISLPRNQKPRTDRKLCTGCGTCVEACPSKARTLVGRYISVDDLLEEVKKDAPFYTSSGGGITVGGGEPTMQPHFVAELLRRSKSELNINTAIETCGYAAYPSVRTALYYADLVFFDIKHIEPLAHRRLTGISNEVVLENIRRIACEADKRIIIRIPVIPGYNDLAETIRKVGEFIARLGRNITRIELLPFHSYGAAKYTKLGRRWKLAHLETPASEHLMELKETLMSTGIDVQIGEAGILTYKLC